MMYGKINVLVPSIDLQQRIIAWKRIGFSTMFIVLLDYSTGTMDWNYDYHILVTVLFKDLVELEHLDPSSYHLNRVRYGRQW